MLPSTSTIILLLRSTQASAPKSIVLLSLKALLAMAKLVNFCLLPSGYIFRQKISQQCKREGYVRL
jgi:hypothetical protein